MFWDSEPGVCNSRACASSHCDVQSLSRDGTDLVCVLTSFNRVGLGVLGKKTSLQSLAMPGAPCLWSLMAWGPQRDPGSTPESG